MPSLAYHEAIPGHHFQISIAQELDLPFFRNNTFFTAYAEGWALYAEQLAWELGWYEDDPYGNLGRLQYEIFRAARLVVDTGIHAKGWTFDEALTYMNENVGFNPYVVNLDFEVSRYIAWPGQATAYKVGMLKILELRQKAIDQLGDQFDLKEFHSVVLGNGSMPLDILEKVVENYIDSKQGSACTFFSSDLVIPSIVHYSGDASLVCNSDAGGGSLTARVVSALQATDQTELTRIFFSFFFLSAIYYGKIFATRW
jgi:hypothetical protein